MSTIALGLVVHRSGTLLPPSARDVLGDALWAMMIAWWIGAIVPRARLQTRGLAALALCCAVEASQLYHAPAIDGIRGTTLGHLILGSDFDIRDIGAYAIGVLAAVVVEHLAWRVNPEARA